MPTGDVLKGGRAVVGTDRAPARGPLGHDGYPSTAPATASTASTQRSGVAVAQRPGGEPTARGACWPPSRPDHAALWRGLVEWVLGGFEARDGLAAALVGDVDVLLGGADAGVPGEVADHLDRDAALGQQGAERVAQDVRCAQGLGRRARSACLATMPATAPGETACRARFDSRLTNSLLSALGGRVAHHACRASWARRVSGRCGWCRPWRRGRPARRRSPARGARRPLGGDAGRARGASR
jgi:hypothetical protein